jgi:hypothetical protein
VEAEKIYSINEYIDYTSKYNPHWKNYFTDNQEKN